MDKYVVSQSLAQKLKDQGYPQTTTQWYWHSLISHDVQRWSPYKLQDYKPDSDFGMKVLAAPMADELLVQLKGYDWRITNLNSESLELTSDSLDDPDGSVLGPDFADTLAELWLLLREQGNDLRLDDPESEKTA